MSRIGEHAVVLGGSISGLLAARVLAGFYRDVTVVERDELSAETTYRRGVPQARHVHGLLSGGLQAIDALFPGILAELAAAGATRLDDGDLSRVSLTFAGHRLCQSHRLVKPLTMYVMSRPCLEARVRQRVRDVDNIHVLDGHDVVEILAGNERVTGVRVARRDTGGLRCLDADLVVDAMGRAARTPALLESLGYGRPEEDRITVQVAYTSQLLGIPADTVRESVVAVSPVPRLPAAGALFGYENNTWMLTLAGLSGYEPPADRAGMLRFAANLGATQLVAALETGEPLGAVAHYRYPASLRRRYEKMQRFPAGLLVVGDAICSFNPVYGQGMTVAAVEAIALRDALRGGERDLSRRFFHAAAKPVAIAWQMAAGADLSLPQVDGRRTVSLRVSNWYTERVLRAAESDGAVAEDFYRVMNMVDPPSSLLHPSVLRRVASANSVRRQRNRRAETAVPAGGR